MHATSGESAALFFLVFVISVRYISTVIFQIIARTHSISTQRCVCRTEYNFLPVVARFVDQKCDCQFIIAVAKFTYI